MTKRLVIGTRSSKLALWQADYVAAALRAEDCDVEAFVRPIITTGDSITDLPLARIGGKGLFTRELERELLAGSIDLAVHSLKDVPTELPPGLTIGAVTARDDPGDALICPRYGTLDALPRGARIGTSSLRRKAQLLNYRPDLMVVDLRGNVETRLAKMQSVELDAIVLAVSGLRRLGRDECITQVLPFEICLPAVGQGVLAVEIRQDDRSVVACLCRLHHAATATAIAAERAFLSAFGSGCQVPIGVYGRQEGPRLVLDAVILSVDGRRKIRDSLAGVPGEAESLGLTLARTMFENGGREILAGIGKSLADGRKSQ